MLGLDVLKEKGATKICVKGDSKLVLNQVKGIYQEKKLEIEGL